MSEQLQPRTAAEVTEAVAWALASQATLAVAGVGSKEGLGRPVRASHRLDLSELRGIALYEPEELVLTAAAATPLAEVEAVLAQRRQMLAFEPPDLSPLLGTAGGTLGGAIACNLSGPRRVSAGAARDHLLGFQATSGRAERFKSGGRVMKNVTGYDLSKLMAGSYGTLAVMDEVTVKVLPAPEKTRTVLLLGLDEAQGVAALCRAMGEPVEVSGAAHLPGLLAAHSAVDRVRQAGTSITALRVEGPAPSVEARCRHLRELFGAAAPTEELHSLNSGRFWAELRDAKPLVAPRERIVWRLSVPPAQGAATVARLRAELPQALAFYDWSGGLVWLSLPPSADADHARVRAAVAPTGGHATLVRAPADLRAAIPVFQPQPPPLAALARRVKDSFDPKGVLNPGRMS